MAGISSGLTAGANFFQGIVDDNRKTAAYNHLKHVYGDIAGDPEAAAKLQAIDQNNQLFPGALQKQGLDNQNTAAQTGLYGAQTGLANSNTAEQEQKNARAAALRAAVTLKGLQTQGADVGAEFDRIVAPNAQSFGITPEDLPKWKQAITSNPQALDAIIKGLQAPDQAQANEQRYQLITQKDGSVVRVPVNGPSAVAQQVPGVTAYQPEMQQQRIDQRDVALQQSGPQGQQDIYRGRQVGEGEGKNIVADLPLPATQRVQVDAAHDAAKQAYDLSQSEIGKALDDVGWKNTGIMSATSFIPGSPAADLETRISGVAARVVLSTMNEMRQMAQASGGSGTGFGQLVTREEEIMAARYSDFQRAASPALKREMLETLKDQLKMSWERTDRAYKADIGARGEGKSAPAQEAPPAKAPVDFRDFFGKPR